MPARRPPAFAHWLLKNFGCSPNNDAVIGDLNERYLGGRSRGWYWTQAILAIIASFFEELWRHKLMASRALIAGWVAKSAWLALAHYEFWQPQSWLVRAYLSPSLWPGFLFLIAFGCAGSAWLIAHVSGANARPMVLLYLAIEMTAAPFLLLFGGPPSWSPFTLTPRGLSFWLAPFSAPINLGFMNLGYISSRTAIFSGTTLMAFTIMFGGGLLGSPPKTSPRAERSAL